MRRSALAAVRLFVIRARPARARLPHTLGDVGVRFFHGTSHGIIPKQGRIAIARRVFRAMFRGRKSGCAPPLWHEIVNISVVFLIYNLSKHKLMSPRSGDESERVMSN